MTSSPKLQPRTVPPNGGTPNQDAAGRFQYNNTAAVKTGRHAKKAQLPDVFEALEADVQVLLDGSLADDGGVDEIPTRRLSQHQYRAALHRQILRLNAALDAHTMFDRRGKLRVLWLGKLESLIREARLLDQSLGLGRRAKNISLDEYLNTSCQQRDSSS